MTDEDQQRVRLLAGQAFSPSTPIKELDVFAGRQREILQIIDAINQDGQHVLIYGERGVGKTSLANVIDDVYLSAANARIFAPHVACDPTDTFDSIWMKLIEEKERVRPVVDLSPQLLGEIDNLADDLNHEFKPHDIRTLCDIIGQTHLFVPIVDEFDRVEDHAVVRLFTDTIKTISDHVRKTTLILVGVGDTVDDLVSEHESVERSLAQVHMRRMADEESKEILIKSREITGVAFSDEAVLKVVALSQGLPHFTHLLGKNCVRAAADAGSWIVRDEHVQRAIDLALETSQQTLRRLYHTAVSSPRPDNLHRQVLLACVLAPVDDLGYFAASDVKKPLSTILGRDVAYGSFTQHLAKLASEDRGYVLQQYGEKRKLRYRFRNPLIQPLALMNGIRDQLLSDQECMRLLLNSGGT